MTYTVKENLENVIEAKLIPLKELEDNFKVLQLNTLERLTKFVGQVSILSLTAWITIIGWNPLAFLNLQDKVKLVCKLHVSTIVSLFLVDCLILITSNYADTKVSEARTWWSDGFAVIRSKLVNTEEAKMPEKIINEIDTINDESKKAPEIYKVYTIRPLYYFTLLMLFLTAILFIVSLVKTVNLMPKYFLETTKIEQTKK